MPAVTGSELRGEEDAEHAAITQFVIPANATRTRVQSYLLA
jgi:hypothetical protein